MPKKFRKTDICHNCHQSIGDYNYCPNCGQVNSHKQIHIRQIMKELLGDVFTFDSKFFKSLVPLIGKPGYLTNEYIAGKRITYILPLRLYVFTTFLFFFLLSLGGSLSPYDLEVEDKLKVTNDTLSQFLDHYKTDVPKDVMERMFLEMGLEYRIEKNRKASVSEEFQDTIKTKLIASKPGLNDSIAADYARQIDGIFYWFLKAKERGTIKPRQTTSSDSLEMGKLLSHFNFKLDQRIKFRSWIDSLYWYNKVTWKQNSANVTIMGVADQDSGILNELDKKAENLVSQGEKGLRIFLSELIRQIPKLMFFLLPVFALLLKLFFIRQKIFYFNHLIFSLHIHSLIFMYLIIAVFFPNGWVIGLTILAIWIHTFLAFKNVYRLKLWMVFLKLNSIIFLYSIVLIFGFVGVSILTVWNT